MARSIPELVCKEGALDSVRHGHPWVWRAALARPPVLHAGAEVLLVDAAGKPRARGIYDPESPIAVRVWASAETAIDEGLFARRVALAFEIRARLFGDDTTAYRLLHGEGDRMPGVVVDRYGTAAVLRTDGAGAEALVPRLAPILKEALGGLGVGSLAHKRAKDDSALLFGPPPPGTVQVSEHGVPFVVDLARGQKTGAFLDQRENRRHVGRLARGKTVLNLFSYAGGFSLHAALGGATKVTSVDIASGAHATAQASFALAKVEVRHHEFVTSDVFEFLARAKREKRTWDIVISDPPSFAPSQKALPKALAAYRSLHKACVEALAPGGTFCASSCSSHVDMAAFAGTLDDAALGRDDLRLLELTGPPADHPTLAGWPEGRYLKFARLE